MFNEKSNENEKLKSNLNDANEKLLAEKQKVLQIDAKLKESNHETKSLREAIETKDHQIASLNTEIAAIKHEKEQMRQ